MKDWKKQIKGIKKESNKQRQISEQAHKGGKVKWKSKNKKEREKGNRSMNRD